MPQNGNTYDKLSDNAAPGAAGTGLITQPSREYMAPALLAEQQRAKSEIEAALTIAAARPRDQKKALDRILINCQRLALAAKSSYEYSRGGTDIQGANIRLMEVVAQNWGNVEFGFRELARFAAKPGAHGESVVEAYAWDLETNTRRKVQFTVSHYDKDRRKPLLVDQRDIYEYVANQAQRRVRTCLENIIPRDIVDAARAECQKTLHAHVDMKPETIAKLISAFEQFGVNKATLEARLQRRIDTITAAQVFRLREIWSSLSDGMSTPEDWFDIPATEPPKLPMDAAKDALRKSGRKEERKDKVKPNPSTKSVEPDLPETLRGDNAADQAADEAQYLDECRDLIGNAEILEDVKDIERRAEENAKLTKKAQRQVTAWCESQRMIIRQKTRESK